jgi:hypothetical protein
MKAVDLHIKVEVDIEEGESPEQTARDILRAIEKIYGVHRAELSSIVEHTR